MVNRHIFIWFPLFSPTFSTRSVLLNKHTKTFCCWLFVCEARKHGKWARSDSIWINIGIQFAPDDGWPNVWIPPPLPPAPKLSQHFFCSLSGFKNQYIPGKANLRVHENFKWQMLESKRKSGRRCSSIQNRNRASLFPSIQRRLHKAKALAFAAPKAEKGKVFNRISWRGALSWLIGDGSRLAALSHLQLNRQKPPSVCADLRKLNQL